MTDRPDEELAARLPRLKFYFASGAMSSGRPG